MFLKRKSVQMSLNETELRLAVCVAAAGRQIKKMERASEQRRWNPGVGAVRHQVLGAGPEKRVKHQP